MKTILSSIARNSSNKTQQEKYLNEIFISISDNASLQAKIEEIFPFLTDGDRMLRSAAMTSLAFIDSQFKVDAVNQALCDMAITKLGDSATLHQAISVVEKSVSGMPKEKLFEVLDNLFSGDLRSNLLSHRLEAYSLLDKLLDAGVEIPPTKDFMHRFNKFCGYEQDPRCLTAIFKLFPKFTHLVIDKLADNARDTLFDVVAVFYPITQRRELSTELCNSLSAVPEFTDETLQLVSSKLTNALSDTRCSVFESLPILISNTKTTVEHVSDLVVSFAKSLSDYFSNGSTDTPPQVINDGVQALISFVRTNEDSHLKLRQTAMENWIPEIINSKDVSILRAYSIVTWGLNTVLNFTSMAMIPLCCVADESYKKGDDAKLQSILASILEFLKFEKHHDDEIKDLSMVVKICANVLGNDRFKKNVIISAIAVLRELSNKSFLPMNESIVPLTLKHANIQDFASQLFCSLAYQTHYFDEITTKLKIPLVSAIKGEIKLEPFASKNELISFASRLCVDDFYSKDILPAFAVSGNTRALLRCVIPLREIDHETAMAIFSAIETLEKDERNSVLAVAIRAPKGTLKEAIPMFPRISPYLMYAAEPCDLPENPLLETDLARFSYGAKKETYIEGFVPPATALAFRAVITKEFQAKDIPTLLEMENLLDDVVGGNFDKFDLLEKLFIYNDDYKVLLWKPFYKSLDSEPLYLCKLCLLCPPDFFIASLDHYIPMLATFVKVDHKGGLDLTLFTLMKLNEDKKLLIRFIAQMANIVPALLEILKNGDAHERLDTVKVLYLICAQLPKSACEPHKHAIAKALLVTLDDPKREIRCEAATARSAWMRIRE